MRLTLLSISVVTVTWLAFVGWLALARPKGLALRDAARMVPAAVGLVRRLATDRTIPRSVRLPAWLLIGYLALPVDLVPDFVPVVGYADDAILVAVVLRRLASRAGSNKVAEHWRGSPEGLAAFRAVLRLP